MCAIVAPFVQILTETSSASLAVIVTRNTELLDDNVIPLSIALTHDWPLCGFVNKLDSNSVSEAYACK